MATLVLTYDAVPNAVSHVIEYSSDNGVNWTAYTGDVTSPVDVLVDPPPGTYIVQVTAKGDGENYLDSDPTRSNEVVIDAPAEKLPSPANVNLIEEETI